MDDSTGSQPDSKPVSGAYAALLTPREPDSIEADAGAMLDYLDKVAEGGVDGLVFFGATGEFVHFELAERMRVLALAVKRSPLPVLVNVSHSTLPGAIALAEQAASANASGLLLMPPYFYAFEDRLIVEFYSQFVNAVGRALPIYLYNLPTCTTPLSMHAIVHLLSSGSITGIKSSDGDWENFEALLQLRRERDFRLLVGNDAICLRALTSGADGSISGVAGAIPELPAAICRAVQSGNGTAAAMLSARLDELLMWIGKLPALLGLKQLAEFRGWLPFRPAVPVDAGSKEELWAFRQWLDDWLPATLAACAAPGALSVRT